MRELSQGEVISSFISGRPVPINKTHILLACWPKTGSTFLQNFLAAYIGGQLAYLGPAGERREQEFDLVTAALWHNQNYVAQQHVRYSSYTQNIINLAQLRPIILIRNIYDAILSMVDHWSKESVLNPMVFVETATIQQPREEQIDLAVDLLTPWYVNFLMTWIRSDYQSHITTYERVFSDFSDFSEIRKIMSALRIEFDAKRTELVLENLESRKTDLRFNVGQIGRGEQQMSEDQAGRVRRLFHHYTDIPDEILTSIGVSPK